MFIAEKESLPLEKQILLERLPKFLDSLREELKNDKSEIFNPAFKPATNSSVSYVARTKRFADTGNENRFAKRMRREVEDLPDDTVLEALNRVNDPNINCTDVMNPVVHSARDDHPKAEERRGIIEFHVVGNSMINKVSMLQKKWLLDLKNVFAHRLPR